MKVEVFGTAHNIEMSAFALVLHRRKFSRDFWTDRKLFAEVLTRLGTGCASANFNLTGDEAAAYTAIFYTLAVLGGEKRSYDDFYEGMDGDIRDFVAQTYVAMQSVLLSDMQSIKKSKNKTQYLQKEEPTAEVLVNRALEIGLKLDDLRDLTTGQIIDLLVSRRNEVEESKKPRVRVATMDDIMAL